MVEIDALVAIPGTPSEMMDLSMLESLREDLKNAELAFTQMSEDDPARQAGIEDIRVLDDAIKALENEQLSRLNDLAKDLEKDFERAVSARREAEKRMVDDERQFHGNRRLRDSKAFPNDAGQNLADENDGTSIHATRSRTVLYASRLTDMMLPTNEIPFRVDPDENPDPTCVFAQPSKPQVDPQTGQPMPVDNSIDPVVDANNRAAAKMQDTIKDQLFEQGLQRHGRKAIFDACRIGVGITKGPFPQYRRKVRVRGTDATVEIEKLSIPGYAYVNPWNFYYDMVSDLAKCRKTFEVHWYDRSTMMDLKKYPNVIGSVIDELLDCREAPEPPANLKTLVGARNRDLGVVEPIDACWCVIETNAAISAERLKRVAGIDWPHPDTMPLIEMWWCNGRCVKWKLSPLECGWRVPYYAFTPFQIDDTIFGASVPYMARDSQSNVDGAWDATLTNAALSAGPLIFARKGSISPVNKAWRFNGPAFFDFTGAADGGSIQDNVYSLILNSNVEGNLSLVQRALDLMDQDTLINQILQGNITEAGTGPASGLVQLINLSTIFQRMICAYADDNWFQPLADQFRIWNLIYSKDLEIKGDFNVVGIASTALVSRDIQTQHLQVLSQMSDNPKFAGFTDDYALWSANVKMLEIPGKDEIVLPRDKALDAHTKLQQGGIPPEIQLKQAELEVQKQKIESDVQIKLAQIARDQEKDQMEAQLQLQKMASDERIENMRLQASLIEASAKTNVDMAYLSEQARQAAEKEQTRRIETGVKATTQAKVKEMELTARPNPHSSLD